MRFVNDVLELLCFGDYYFQSRCELWEKYCKEKVTIGKTMQKPYKLRVCLIQPYYEYTNIQISRPRPIVRGIYTFFRRLVDDNGHQLSPLTEISNEDIDQRMTIRFPHVFLEWSPHIHSMCFPSLRTQCRVYMDSVTDIASHGPYECQTLVPATETIASNVIHTHIHDRVRMGHRPANERTWELLS